MEMLILDLVKDYPMMASIFMIIGVLRSIFKPLMTLLHSYVDATPSEKDNASLEKLKASKVFAALVWFIDYSSSIKLPPAKK